MKNKVGRPRGSKNRIKRGTLRLLKKAYAELEELEVDRVRLRLAAATYNGSKTVVALAAIRVHAKHIVKVLDPLFGSD